MVQNNVRKFVIPAQPSVGTKREIAISDNDIQFDANKKPMFILPMVIILLIIIACASIAGLYLIISPINAPAQVLIAKTDLPVAGAAIEAPHKAASLTLAEKMQSPPVIFPQPSNVTTFRTVVALPLNIPALSSPNLQETKIQYADKVEAQTLIIRSQHIIYTSQDIATARLFLERALKLDEPKAAFMLAQTYDPGTLRQYGVKGVTGDINRARALYEQAIKGGVSEAQLQLNQLR